MLERLTLAAAAICLVLLACGPAHAAPVVDGEFVLTGNPERLAVGPDGNIWATLAGSSAGNEIARITPAGAVTEYDSATLVGARGIAAGPNGRMWVTISGKLGHFDPADPVGSATAIPVAQVGQSDIAAGPDGNLWTPNVNKLVRVTPAGAATEFPILTNASRVAASANAIWVADFGGGEIVRVTTDGVPTRFAVGGSPQGAAIGLGGQVAYTNPGTTPHTVGRVQAGGAIVPTNVAPGTDPFGIAFGPDRAYWFAQPFGNNLGRLTAGGAYSQLGGFSAEAGPRFVVAGPGNTLWVALHGLNGNDAKKVARVSGVEPTPGGGPGGPGQPMRLLGLRLTPKLFRVAKRPTAVSSLDARLWPLNGANPASGAVTAAVRAQKRGARRRAKAGTTIRFRLSGDARAVRLTVQRRLAGRRAGKRCVAPKPRLRSRKRCVRFVKRGTLVRRDLKAGARRIAFSGRIGRRALKPGRYRLTAVAVPADGTRPLATRRTAFTIVAR